MAESFSEFVELFQRQEAENHRLRESLDRLEGMIDRNWKAYYGGDYDEQGPSLEQIKETAKRNRELMALNPHVGNGLEVINSYVWSDGVHYEGVPKENRGKGVNVQERIDNPINQENFFGQQARKQRQTAFYCDGNVLYWGDDSGYTLHPLSITDVSDDYRNPENPSEIWAYRRTWKVRKNVTNPGRGRRRVQVEEKHEWIFVNRFMDKRGDRKVMKYNDQDEPIALNKRIFVKKSNPVVGWSYGISDVQRGITHADSYRRAMENGEVMTASMASIFATMKQNTPTGAANAAVTVGNATQAGGIAQVGQQNTLTAMATAGQAYDFGRLLPILANFAAGIGISVVALSMNSGNAGGSYGAAKALDRPEQLSTKVRRNYNAELDWEVLVWLGAKPEKLEIWFDPIIDLTEKYRGEQIVELRTGTGLYKGEDIKRLHAILDGRDPDKVGPVPKGWLIPQNRESVELRQIDPNTNISGQTGGNPSNGGGMAPTQGSGAKTVKTGSGDQKSDDIRTNREALAEYLSLKLNITPAEAELLVEEIPE